AEERAHGGVLREGGARLLYCDSMLNQLSADRGERERLQRMFEQAPGFMAVLEPPAHRVTVADRAFHDPVGGRDLVGRAVANAIPEFAGQGFIDILDQISQ